MKDIRFVFIDRENTLRLYAEIHTRILEYFCFPQHLAIFNEQPHRLILRREHPAIHQEDQLRILLKDITEVAVAIPLRILPEHPDLGEAEGLGLGGLKKDE